MSDQDVFNKNAETPAPVPAGTVEDKLKAIVNENGEPKYKDTTSALDALIHSQKHISTLEQERAADRAELARLREVEAAQRTMEEVVARLAGSPQSAQPKTITEGVMDERKISELVKAEVAAMQQGTLQKQNRDSVNSELLKSYGEKATEMVQAKAKELDITLDAFGKLAEANPKLVLGLFKDVKVTQPAPAHGTHTAPAPVTPTGKYEPGVSLVRGGLSNKELARHMAEIKKLTNARLGVE